MRVLPTSTSALKKRQRWAGSPEPMCQQADKNRVSWVTDGRIVVRHANGSWSFQASDHGAGRSARAVTARAEQRYMPKAGTMCAHARRCYCRQARARTDGFGH